MSVHYRLTSRREGGVLADLFLAERADDGVTVEVKLFHPETTDPDYARALVEANQALATVSSPGHLRVLDLGVVEDRLAVIREPADGPSFGALLGHLVAEGRPLLQEVSLTLLIQLAQDLQAAHGAGVVHGGLTPGNVHVSPLGRIRIADFGAMPALWASARLREGLLKGGRAAYRAPEAGRDAARALSPTADVFSLGAIAYELLTLQEPVPGRDGVPASPARLRPELIPRLDAHLLRALSPRPATRFQTAEAFAEALRHLLVQHGGAPSAADLRQILAARLPPVPVAGDGELPWAEEFSLAPIDGLRMTPGPALAAPPRPRRSYSRRPRNLPADERPTEEVTPELLEEALEALYAGVPAMSDEGTERPKDASASGDPSEARTPPEGSEAWSPAPVTSWEAPSAATPPPPLSRKTHAASEASSVRRTGRHARVKAVEDFQPREAESAPVAQVRGSGARARVTGSRAAIVARADLDAPLPPRSTGSRRAVGGEGARPSGVREAPARSTGSRRSVGAARATGSRAAVDGPRGTGSRAALGGGAARRSGVRRPVVPHAEPEHEERDSLAEYEQQLVDQKRQAELDAEHRRYVAAQQKRLRDKIVRLVMAASVLLACIAGLAIYFHQKLQPEFIPPPPVPIGVSAEDAKFSAFNEAVVEEAPAPTPVKVTGALLTVRSNHPANIYLDGRKLSRRAPAARLPIPMDVKQVDVVSLTTKQRRSFQTILQRGKVFTVDVTFDAPPR